MSRVILEARRHVGTIRRKEKIKVKSKDKNKNKRPLDAEMF